MTLIASTDPSKGVKGLSAFMVEMDREGIPSREERKQNGYSCF